MKLLLTAISALLISPLSMADIPSPPGRLCVDDNCTEAADSPSTGGIKWNPGHYMLVYLGTAYESVVTNMIPEVCRETGLKGLQFRVEWGDVERAKDSYDFSKIDGIYEALSKCNKRLVLQVQSRVNRTDSAIGSYPSYILNDSEYKGGVAQNKTGFIARLWDEPVMTRYIAMIKALGARYDHKPHFEAIVLAETATGGVVDGSGYSGPAYLSQLKRAITAVSGSWPTTNFIVYANYMSNVSDSEFVGFINFIRQNRGAVGGPDTLPPPHNGTKGEAAYRGEMAGDDLRGEMPAAFAVQTPELGGKEGDFTPKQLYEHCVGTNRCSHMFWIRNVGTGGPEQLWSTGILPFLRTGPKTNEACPRNYATCRV